jgi:hypothetical protein
MQSSPLELLGATTTRTSVGILGGDGRPRTRDILGLLAVEPDVDKPLQVVALCEVSMLFVCFDLYNYIAEVGKGESLLG